MHSSQFETLKRHNSIRKKRSKLQTNHGINVGEGNVVPVTENSENEREY
jgi:hypothetical protein